MDAEPGAPVVAVVRDARHFEGCQLARPPDRLKIVLNWIGRKSPRHVNSENLRAYDRGWVLDAEDEAGRHGAACWVLAAVNLDGPLLHVQSWADHQRI